MLPDVAVLNLGHSLINAAAGKRQKFSMAIEAEETVKFCWDLILAIDLSEIHWFNMFLKITMNIYSMLQTSHSFHPFHLSKRGPRFVQGLNQDYGFSAPLPATRGADLQAYNGKCKIDKDIIDTCYDTITEFVNKIITKYYANLHRSSKWVEKRYTITFFV